MEYPVLEAAPHKVDHLSDEDRCDVAAWMATTALLHDLRQGIYDHCEYARSIRLELVDGLTQAPLQSIAKWQKLANNNTVIASVNYEKRIAQGHIHDLGECGIVLASGQINPHFEIATDLRQIRYNQPDVYAATKFSTHSEDIQAYVEFHRKRSTPQISFANKSPTPKIIDQIHQDSRFFIERENHLHDQVS